MRISKMVLVLMVSLLFAADVSAIATPKEQEMEGRTDSLLPNVTARSAIVMEADTGRIIYARDMKARRFPASTTKTMTLIVALEKGNLRDIVTVGKNAEGTEGSTLWLEEGDRIPLEDLLYGIMMMSGNDATIAIAEHIAGNVETFTEMMTAKAMEIGAEDTSFVNPHGLPDERHYSTAYDLALIAAYGYQNPKFVDIVSTREKTLPWIKDPAHFWRSENQMLWLYDGANGVKTGYTDAAGRCLVAGAKRNGIQLVSVVLDSLYMWSDSIALLDYGFQHVKPMKIVSGMETVTNLPVLSGRKKQTSIQTGSDIFLPVGDEGAAEFEKVYDLPDRLHAPVKAGDVVGKLRIMYGGKEVASTDLIAAESVEMKSFFVTLYRMVRACFA